MTLGSHQATVGKSQDWITPRWIIDALGPFDLDPCAANPRPWDCARINYVKDEMLKSGLDRPWFDRVWVNPPFDRYRVGDWIAKLAVHGRGTALLHARTEADWFEPVWTYASAILFLADRLYFHYPDGRRAKANSGAPAVLCAFSNYDRERLEHSGINGYLATAWTRK
jgi:hypothetical protein